MPLQSLSRLPDPARQQICDALNKSLADTIAMYLAIKTAHWNGKGPNFIALHKFFDELADNALDRADKLAERIIGLGCPAHGTPVFVSGSMAADYPADFADVLSHVGRLLNAYGVYADGLRDARMVAESLHDPDTKQLLDAMITDVEHDDALLRPHTVVLPQVFTAPAVATR